MSKSSRVWCGDSNLTTVAVGWWGHFSRR